VFAIVLVIASVIYCDEDWDQGYDHDHE
jgi:hypothetical protein